MQNRQTRALWSAGLLALVTLSALLAGLLAETPSVLAGEDAAQAAATSTATPAAGQGSAAARASGRPAGWDVDSHGKGADPNYGIVFPKDKVNQITITIDPTSWEAMQENMTGLFGEQGDEGRFPGGPVGMQPPAPGEAFAPPAAGGRPQGFPGRPGMGGDFTTENPMWVTATITFNGETWTDVGVRYKGNSSLSQGWRSGSLSLPFKLDFDEWEDANPAIKDQRFYGFKQLSLSNNMGDASLMRETLAYDVLEEAGLPAAETAFYAVILDYGAGPVNLGLYTMVEVVDDTLIERIFGDDNGNIYEGDGSGVTLAEGAFDQIETSFQKENNEDEADWSDIEALYAVLHSETRTTDPATWRAELEEIFDVDGFLEWLAVSTVIGHWDTYGAMNHNFYLYDNPESGQLTWISWDHNFTFQSGGMGGGRVRFEAPAPAAGAGAAGENADEAAPAQDRLVPAEGMMAPPEGMQPGGGRMGGPGGRSASLDKADVTEEWPLIRFLLDDPLYYEAYTGYLAETLATAFDAQTLAARIEQYAEILAPYAGESAGAEEYSQAVEQVITFIEAQSEAVQSFLDEQG